jgi:hypothetical protein
LPQEHRGGSRHARSLLNEENVKVAARTWLTAQKTGSVTPRCFCDGLNQEILPSLGILLSNPLCECTACRWLVRLGWMQKTLHKGVYMDGHERPDVIKYREDVFLPRLLEYEQRMVKFELEGDVLHRVEPHLQPGERLLIPLWQDETCFHANEWKKNAW